MAEPQPASLETKLMLADVAYSCAMDTRNKALRYPAGDPQGQELWDIGTQLLQATRDFLIRVRASVPLQMEEESKESAI